VSAIVLLPINSAANPFLYSDALDILWEKLAPVRKRLRSILEVKHGDTTTAVAMTETQSE